MATTIAPATAPATAPEIVPVIPVTPVVEDTPNFEAVFTRLQTITATVKELQQEVKVIQRLYGKAAKARKSKKSKTAKSSAAPSGFAKPTPLSDELAAFLDLSPGSELPRTEVTRLLNKYIKDNNLQNPADKRTILPDAKLKGLLKVNEGDKVTYFNLQSFMKPHFKKE